MADLPEIGQTSPSSSWVLRRPLLGTASICPFPISSSSWANRRKSDRTKIQKIQSCSASGKRRLEFGIYGLFVGKSHWTHHFVCFIGRHWCGAWVSKKSVNFVLPQSPTHAKIHQISCDYEELGSWIILLTLFWTFASEKTCSILSTASNLTPD